MIEMDFEYTDLPMGPIEPDRTHVLIGFGSPEEPDRAVSVLVTRESAVRLVLELARLVEYGQSGSACVFVTSEAGR